VECNNNNSALSDVTDNSLSSAVSVTSFFIEAILLVALFAAKQVHDISQRIKPTFGFPNKILCVKILRYKQKK